MPISTSDNLSISAGPTSSGTKQPRDSRHPLTDKCAPTQSVGPSCRRDGKKLVTGSHVTNPLFLHFYTRAPPPRTPSEYPPPGPPPPPPPPPIRRPVPETSPAASRHPLDTHDALPPPPRPRAPRGGGGGCRARSPHGDGRPHGSVLRRRRRGWRIFRRAVLRRMEAVGGDGERGAVDRHPPAVPGVRARLHGRGALRLRLRRRRRGLLAFAARALASGGGGARPAWVFDVDETLLTNAPYYAVNGWGWVHSPCISLPFLYCSCTKLKRFAKQRVAIFVFTGEILPLIERVVRKFCVLCYSCKLRSCENYLY